MFHRDDEIAELLRRSTELKDAQDMQGAIACLYIVKKLMLKSKVSYPAETWCKLPLYLQQAGLFDESMAEFQDLLNDLPRRAGKDVQLDNSSVGSEDSKRRHFENLTMNDARVIGEKMELARKREAKTNVIKKHL